SSPVTIVGSIKGAEKVVVNGYTLSQFTAGSTQWRYVASVDLGNLKPGDNTFEVYGIDPDGNKSDVVTFTITYNGPAAESSPDPEEAEEPAEQSSSEETPAEEPAEEPAEFRF